MQRVIFRKWKSNGSIIAFFPDQQDGQYIGSYEHVGQHGNASYPHPQTDPASPAEYADLLAELRSIGYKLRIVTRYTKPKPKPAVNLVSIDEIKKIYSPGIGRHWFDADTKRFFRSRFSEYGYQSEKGGPIYFVSSEQNHGALSGKVYPRLYTVRKLAEGEIATVGEFQQYSSSASANAAARRYAMHGEE